MSFVATVVEEYAAGRPWPRLQGGLRGAVNSEGSQGKPVANEPTANNSHVGIPPGPASWNRLQPLQYLLLCGILRMGRWPSPSIGVAKTNVFLASIMFVAPLCGRRPRCQSQGCRNWASSSCLSRLLLSLRLPSWIRAQRVINGGNRLGRSVDKDRSGWPRRA